jgi:hypothetical protein
MGMNHTPTRDGDAATAVLPNVLQSMGQGAKGKSKLSVVRQMKRQGRSGVQGGHTHGGAAPGKLDRGAGGSFFFGERGGRGRAAVLPPLPQGAPRATVQGGRGRQRLRIAVRLRTLAYNVRERK